MRAVILMTKMVGDAVAELLPDTVTRPLNVLVVDRSADITEQFIALLHHFGHAAHAASTAEAAMALVAQAKMDAVISGLKLGGTDGFALAASLRAHPNARDACLVAVSGATGGEVVERALAAGFDAHFCKPVSVDQILHTLAITLNEAR